MQHTQSNDPKNLTIFNTANDESCQLFDSEQQPDLPYARVRSISCWFFLKETAFFSANYVMDRMTFIITFILFRVGGFTQAIAILGLVILAIDLFFCLSRDFQETVGIVLGPYYSKGDSKNYYKYLVVLVFWNAVFFAVCLPFAFFQKEFYSLLGVNSGILGPATAATKQYMLSACAFLSTSNFIKGGKLDRANPQGSSASSSSKNIIFTRLCLRPASSAWCLARAFWASSGHFWGSLWRSLPSTRSRLCSIWR